MIHELKQASGAIGFVSVLGKSTIAHDSQEFQCTVAATQHDGLWMRVKGAVFTEPTSDIYDRLRLVTAGDVAVIAPLGGDGTELEVAALLHENIIRATQRETCYGLKPTPVIFLLTANGTDWRRLISTKMQLLATSIKAIEQCPWILFAYSTGEFAQAFEVARKMI